MVHLARYRDRVSYKVGVLASQCHFAPTLSQQPFPRLGHTGSRLVRLALSPFLPVFRLSHDERGRSTVRNTWVALSVVTQGAEPMRKRPARWMAPHGTRREAPRRARACRGTARWLAWSSRCRLEAASSSGASSRLMHGSDAGPAVDDQGEEQDVGKGLDASRELEEDRSKVPGHLDRAPVLLRGRPESSRRREDTGADHCGSAPVSSRAVSSGPPVEVPDAHNVVELRRRHL